MRSRARFTDSLKAHGMNGETVKEILKLAAGWFVLSILLAIGMARWYRYQREMDERDASTNVGKTPRCPDEDR